MVLLIMPSRRLALEVPVVVAKNMYLPWAGVTTVPQWNTDGEGKCMVTAASAAPFSPAPPSSCGPPPRPPRDGGHALAFQRADVGHIRPTRAAITAACMEFSSRARCPCRSGSRLGDGRAAGLQTLRHLTEGLHDGLIYVLHAYSPILRCQRLGKSHAWRLRSCGSDFVLG